MGEINKMSYIWAEKPEKSSHQAQKGKPNGRGREGINTFCCL